MLAITRKNRTYVASLQGERRLNVLNAPHVKKQLNEILMNGNKVILDMNGILFIDTEGFAVLDEAFKKTKKTEGTFKLANVSSEVKELIGLMQLTDKFVIIRNIEEEILGSVEA